MARCRPPVENVAMLRNLRAWVELRLNAHGSRLELTEASVTVCGLLDSFRILQNVLQGRIRGRLSESTTDNDNAVSACRPKGVVDADTTLFVLVNLRGIEDAFDCLILPN